MSSTDESIARSRRVRPAPEDSSEEIVVKPFCECDKCKHWSTSVDWCPTSKLQFENQASQPKVRGRRQPILRTPQNPGAKPNNILNYDIKTLSLTERQSASKLLVHGLVIPHPVQMFSETHFHEDIQSVLRTLIFKYSLGVQSFVWPALFRQQNVFLIDDPKRGKTMAYLPAICTFPLKEDQSYKELAKHKGPLVIIVCPNSETCEEIFDLIRKLYATLSSRPKVSILTYPTVYINNMDILVTIPQTLVNCVKSRIFNLKRLCHLVFEDASTLLRTNDDSIYSVLRVTDEMLEHRANGKKVQVIVTSTKWSSDLGKLLKHLYETPLVCIGNHLEAALYGQAEFEINFLKSQHKKAYLEGLLKNKSNLYKTVVICKMEEISELNKWLVRNGVETLCSSDNSDKEVNLENENTWRQCVGGQYKVFLCTDSVLNMVSINEAVWLVHYSFPDTWLKFVKRFSCLSTQLQSPLTIKEDVSQCKSFLMISDSNEEQMPKIWNLLTRLKKSLPPSFEKYADVFKMEMENEKILQETALCPRLKLFGSCPTWLCKHRHALCPSLDVTGSYPKNGKLTFKVLEIKDVTRFAVQLLNVVHLDGTDEELSTDDLTQPIKYPEGFKPHRVGNEPKIDAFYAHQDGGDYVLCHVLRIENHTFVEVKLTRTGQTLQTLKTKLYELPSNIKIAEIYLCNLIPPNNDENFSSRSFHFARSNILYREKILTGDIYLQLNNTLWVNEVVEAIKIDKITAIKFNLVKRLLELAVVKHETCQIERLYKLCHKCQIELPPYIIKPVGSKSVKVKDAMVQRAFLEGEGINEVILSNAVTPGEFYVRLYKFQCLLENLEKEIKTTPDTKRVEITIGKHYLAPSPDGSQLSRSLLLQTEQDKALVFYVDYGDEAIVPLAQLRNLPAKLIAKLPFQAILCQLHGLAPSGAHGWSDTATDVLYKYLLEPNSDIFRSLFVAVKDKRPVSGNPRTDYMYSVLLKDGYGTKNVLINRLMVDCGLAVEDECALIEDFVLPDADGGGSELSDDEEIKKEDFLDFDEFEGDMEVEIIDAEEMLKFFGVSAVTNPNPQVEVNTNTNQTLLKVKDSPSRAISDNPDEQEENSSQNLTPELFWSQTQKDILIKIKLIGVTDYKVNVLKRRIFTFWSNIYDKTYELKFPLSNSVELTKHRALGQEVQVLLSKMEDVEWDQLTGSKKRMRNIHYEIPDHQLDEPKRKFLQLDIDDEDALSEGNDGPMCYDISDMDSDLDREIDGSDS